MIRLCIVEDDDRYISQFQGYIARYEQEHHQSFETTVYHDAETFTFDFHQQFDIILMDIQMKKMDGMEAAKIVRKSDQNVVIIFITNMVNYAIQGYAVGAMNYILKPVKYFVFAQQIEKAVSLKERQSTMYVPLLRESSMVRIDVSDILYIESSGHNLTIHCFNETYTTRDTLKNMEERLKNADFARCHNYYLVNLRYVENVENGEVTVKGSHESHRLAISRGRMKAFMQQLAEYLGRAVG